MILLPKPKWIIGTLAILYLLSINVDTMDVDASQYASMSCEMMESGSYLQVYEQGRDYLDKPPFLFWITSVSMKIFGANNVAFKLPSILFALLALFATYRLARLYYDETIARLALLMLGTTQALFLITNDVKTDTILMGWVVLSLWQLATWVETKQKKSFLFGCAAIAFGMMTKGPIALLVPIFAMGAHLLLLRRLKLLLEPVLLLGILVIAILLTPMSIGLYQQFDLHPEKTVNGTQGVSGLRFFYWTQSFGRITGESVWNNGASFTFLFENLLWGWLPWTFFLIAGLLMKIVALLKNRLHLKNGEEAISLGGFLITYCSLAISKFQLPHYIYVVLPLAAIISAKPLYALLKGSMPPLWSRIMLAGQWLVVTLLLGFPLLLILWVFPGKEWLPWLILFCQLCFLIYVLLSRRITHKVLLASFIAIIGFNVLLSTWFYPNLLRYQASNNAGRFVKEQGVPAGKFVMYQYQGNKHSVHFYSRQVVKQINHLDSIATGTWILTDRNGKKTIEDSEKNFEQMKAGPDFHVSMLTPAFLNARTRPNVLDSFYIFRLNE